ncbi:MAG: lipocalin family protein [Flavobacteriaceae bacterium]
MIIKNSIKPYLYFIISLIIINFFGCDFNKKPATYNSKLLIGSWLDRSKAKLHFTLLENGVAKSDNMETLVYKSWSVRNDSLFLKVKSIGNRTHFETIEAYKIDTLDSNTLVLHNKNFKMSYTRKK